MRRLLLLLALLAAGAPARAADKAKRQIFREQVLPRSGGKIPAEAFRVDRLALNRLNKEGIAVPDGVVLDARPPARHHKHLGSDLERAVVKVLLTPEAQRFVSPAGQSQPSQPVTVDSTYIIRPPIGTHPLKSPAVGRPLPAPPLQIPTEGGAAGTPQHLQHLHHQHQHHQQQLQQQQLQHQQLQHQQLQQQQHHQQLQHQQLQQQQQQQLQQQQLQQQQLQQQQPLLQHRPQQQKPPPPTVHLATLPPSSSTFDWLYPSAGWESWESLLGRVPSREERGAPWRLSTGPLTRLTGPFDAPSVWASCVQPHDLTAIPRCQTFHFCQPDGTGDPLLCPSGAVFSSSLGYCDWLLNVRC